MLVHPLKALSPITVTLLPIIRLSIPEQPWKASLPTDTTLFGITSVSKFEQYLKAPLEILCTESPMINFVKYKLAPPRTLEASKDAQFLAL